MALFDAGWGELVAALDRVQISVDSLNTVSAALSTTFSAASGDLFAQFDVASNNLVAELETLNATVAAASANLLSQMQALADALKAAKPTPTVLPGPAQLTAKPVPVPTAQAAPSAQTPGGSGLNDALGSLQAGFARVGTIATQLGSHFAAITGPAVALSAGLNLASNLVGGAFGAALGAAGAAAGAFAQAAERALAVMERMAALAAPAVIEQFNQQIQNLGAAFGTAFVPFFQAMIGIVNEINGALFTSLRALQPFFAQLAGIIGSVLVPIAQQWGAQLQTLLPTFEGLLTVLKLAADLYLLINSVLAPINNLIAALLSLFVVLLKPLFLFIDILIKGVQLALLPFVAVIKIISAVVQGLAAIFQAFFAPIQAVMALVDAFFDSFQEVFDAFNNIVKVAVETLVQFIAALFGGFDVKDALASLKDVTKKVVEALYLFAVRVSLLLTGSTKFAENLIKSLQPKDTAVAAKETSLKGFEDIGKDLALAASKAVGATGKAADQRSDNEKLIGEIQEVIKNSEAEQEKLRNFLKEQFDNLAQAIVDAIAGKVGATAGSLVAPTGQQKGFFDAVLDGIIPGRGIARHLGSGT